MLRDQKNHLAIVQLLEAKSRAAGAAKSAIVPVTSGRALSFAFNYGVFVPNTATLPVSAKLQESDTTVDGDFTDVDAEDQVGTIAGVLVTAANDQRSEMVGYTGAKKYVRAVLTVPADATSLIASVDAIIGMGDSPLTAPTALAAT